MAKFKIAANMEFVRSADKGFEEGVQTASELGYRYIEPMVHTGWELLSEVHYFHSYSMEQDNLLMREICDKHGVKVASISGHSRLAGGCPGAPRAAASGRSMPSSGSPSSAGRSVMASAPSPCRGGDGNRAAGHGRLRWCRSN